MVSCLEYVLGSGVRAFLSVCAVWNLVVVVSGLDYLLNTSKRSRLAVMMMFHAGCYVGALISTNLIHHPTRSSLLNNGSVH